MSLIKRPAEIVGKETIACLIYGQSGMGKTTLACSAPAPVLLDFDGGIDRLNEAHQVPTVQITSWKDAEAALAEIEQADEFKTIIVDTLSKMIDSIITDICGAAQPKIQQWGLVNAKFKGFLRTIQAMHKNVVFVAQREVEKDGEVTRYVPQVRASNYKDIICDLDVCGYMEMVSNKGKEVRQITFNPSSRSEGKNTADFAPAYIIPTLDGNKANTFLAERFTEYVARQRERNERRATLINAVSEKMKEYAALLAECNDAMSINEVLQKAKTEKAVGDLRLRIAAAIKDRATALGLTLNKDNKLYA